MSQGKMSKVVQNRQNWRKLHNVAQLNTKWPKVDMQLCATFVIFVRLCGHVRYFCVTLRNFVQL